jgi:hypothetical protein
MIICKSGTISKGTVIEKPVKRTRRLGRLKLLAEDKCCLVKLRERFSLYVIRVGDDAMLGASETKNAYKIGWTNGPTEGYILVTHKVLFSQHPCGRVLSGTHACSGCSFQKYVSDFFCFPNI